MNQKALHTKLLGVKYCADLRLIVLQLLYIREHLIKLLFIAVPYIVLAPEMPVYHVKVGETNIVVKCFGKGNPAPSISWERKVRKSPCPWPGRWESLTIC